MHPLASSPLFWIVFLIGATILTIPTLWAIWHVYHREFASVEEKKIWMALSIFFPTIGGVIYYFFGRNRGHLPS